MTDLYPSPSPANGPEPAHDPVHELRAVVLRSLRAEGVNVFGLELLAEAILDQAPPSARR